MKLHIFNPEHDLALASNSFYFIAPHHVKQMREDLAFLPALWADDGDMVLVSDVKIAWNKVEKLKPYVNNVTFVSSNYLKDIDQITQILPWGWDKALRYNLQRNGIPKTLLPTDEFLGNVREISNRWWAGQKLLKRLCDASTERIGKSFLITHIEELDNFNYKYVIKAPWSSSGRGIRYVNGITKHQQGWAKNIIKRQGSLVLEPFYHKITDFAVELYAYADHVEYMGLSIFHTVNGAYNGNILATEAEKREIISQYIPFQQVQSAIDDICNILNHEMVGKYIGPFGIDMMVVNENGTKLHPCVELNLRRTMGHVALSLKQIASAPNKLMQIYYNDGFHFSIHEATEDSSASLW